MKLFKNIQELLQVTYKRISQINIGLYGAAIAFYAIFSTVPLLIIIIWLISIFLGSELGQAELIKWLSSIAGPNLTEPIQEMIRSSTENMTGFWSSLIASIVLLFGATKLLSQVKYTLNRIWGIENPKIGVVRYFLWDRLKALLFVGSLSLLFILGLASESILHVMDQALMPLFGRDDLFLIQLGSRLTNIVLAFTFFAALFKFLPDIEARFRDIAVGALVTTILVLIGKALVDWYLSASALQPVYKAAGSFVIYLIWIYYNVQVMLIGAMFTQVFTERFGGRVRPYWNASLRSDWYSGDEYH